MAAQGSTPMLPVTASRFVASRPHRIYHRGRSCPITVCERGSEGFDGAWHATQFQPVGVVGPEPGGAYGQEILQGAALHGSALSAERILAHAEAAGLAA